MAAINLSDRATAAIRNLPPKDSSAVMRSLEYLRAQSVAEALLTPKVKKLRLSISDSLYSFRATGTLRLILSKTGNGWLVEDLFARERLERLEQAVRNQ